MPRRLLAALVLACLAAPPLLPAARAQQSPPAEAPHRAFAAVVDGAEAAEGLFRLYRSPKDDLWLEVTPEMLERTYFLQVTSASGLGGREGGATAGDRLRDALFTFRRVRDRVLFTVRQTHFRAPASDPVARSVERSFGATVLASFPVESQPHPERKSVLVNATSLFFADLPALAPRLGEALKGSYSLDRSRSYVETVRAFPRNVEVECSYTFAAPAGARPAQSRVLPDGKALAVRVRYSFLALPEGDYRPRLADPRVGYFTTTFRDLAEDDPEEEFTRYVLRWDLRKYNDGALVSPAREPIVFWLDNAIPVRYRRAVGDGLSLWNKAFERLGLRDAVVVRQMPDGSEIDPFDARYNVVRWATSAGDGSAVALFRANPLTGQILNASIRLDASLFGIVRRAFRWEDELQDFTGAASVSPPASALACELGREAVRESAVALTALQLGGRLNEVEREKFTHQLIAEIVAHEMGHVLGLRHNFKASTLWQVKDLHNTTRTGDAGVTASVMDYNPPNLAPPGVRQGDYYSTTIGPYDIWAIEYGYGLQPGATPEAERAGLQKLASRAGEPELSYATDEDAADLGFAPYASDPHAARWDLSGDPLAYARQRAKMVQDLFKKVETATPRAGAGYQETVDRFHLLLGDYLRSFRVAARYVGGVTTSRVRRSDPRAPRTPLTVVPVLRQREALAYIRARLFEPEAFQFSPTLLNMLAAERHLDWAADPFRGEAMYSVSDRVLTTQRAMLAWLFHPGLLARIRDNESRAGGPTNTLNMAELFATMTVAIFSELRDVTQIVTVPSALRRELQRAYVSVLVKLYLRSDGAPADAQSLARFHLRRLQTEITQSLAVRQAEIGPTTRAHLEWLGDRIDRAFRAQAAAAD